MGIQLESPGLIEQLSAGRLGRRVSQLLVGLLLYGVSMALMVEGDLGLAPWDVLSIGLAGHLGLSFGQTTIVISGVVLLGWLPLRELPGLGTVLNAVLIGVFADLGLAALPTPAGLVPRAFFMAGGVVLCALATGMYIGAQLGRGPRDGLMTGLARMTGASLRLARTGLEVSVLAAGLLLGGPLGLGAGVFALSIGPLSQFFLPLFLVTADGVREATARPSGQPRPTTTAVR